MLLGGVGGFVVCFPLVTLIVSGWCALVFGDLKKVVALSTCKNIN